MQSLIAIDLWSIMRILLSFIYPLHLVEPIKHINMQKEKGKQFLILQKLIKNDTVCKDPKQPLCEIMATLFFEIIEKLVGTGVLDCPKTKAFCCAYGYISIAVSKARILSSRTVEDACPYKFCE